MVDTRQLRESLHQLKVIAIANWKTIISALVIFLFGVGLLLFAFHVLNPFILVIYWPKESLTNPRSKEIEGVPGLYGPGAYSTWVLCTISAIISSAIRDPASSMLSTDLIASIIYSTSSTYWFYGQVVWYRPKNLDIIQDYSFQAASLVLNISIFFHWIGLVLSMKKRTPWSFMVFWDWCLWSLSPLTFIDTLSACMHFLPIIIILGIHVGLEHMSVQFREFVSRRNNPNTNKASAIHFSFLLPSILCETLRMQSFTTSFSILPKSAAKITDLDQMVSLITGIAVVVHQWKLWNLPGTAYKLYSNFRRNIFRGHSIELEASTSVPRNV
ncbi:hypothetical protein CPB86DRAFT_789317 [Serendipita vermifera]|nr:hypothetical protein CPB86DRAFT_789317 [Serendipita vermifera]